MQCSKTVTFVSLLSLMCTAICQCLPCSYLCKLSKLIINKFYNILILILILVVVVVVVVIAVFINSFGVYG